LGARFGIVQGKKANTIILPEYLVASGSGDIVRAIFDAEATRLPNKITIDIRSFLYEVPITVVPMVP
jgi:hypothetical protein